MCRTPFAGYGRNVMHRRLHSTQLIALTASLGLLLLLALGAPLAAAAQECEPADDACTEATQDPTCTCASEGVWPPPEPCVEEPAEADGSPIPDLPISEGEDDEAECSEPPEDAAAPGATPEPTAPPAAEVPEAPEDPEASEMPAVPTLPTPDPAPPAPEEPPAPAEPPIRSAAPRGSTPDAVDADGGLRRATPSPPAQSTRPSFQMEDREDSGDDGVSDVIAPSIAPDPDLDSGLDSGLDLESDPQPLEAPEVALADPEVEPSDEEALAMAAPSSTLPVQGGDWQDATARMLGGMLIGFAIGLGMLVGGLHLHRRGGVEPPRRPTSPLRLRS